MKFGIGLLTVLLMVLPVCASPIIITSESAFLEYIQEPYFYESFDDYEYKEYTEPTLTMSQNGFTVTLSADGRDLYSLDGSMSTRFDNDSLRIDFSDSINPVTAVGGYFWPTDEPGENLIGDTSVVLSDGTVVMIENADSGNFIGFISIDNTALEYLEVSVHVDYTWPTVDDLYVGTAIPEPSSYIFLITGICGVFLAVIRNKHLSRACKKQSKIKS